LDKRFIHSAKDWLQFNRRGAWAAKLYGAMRFQVIEEMERGVICPYAVFHPLISCADT